MRKEYADMEQMLKPELLTHRVAVHLVGVELHGQVLDSRSAPNPWLNLATPKRPGR